MKFSISSYFHIALLIGSFCISVIDIQIGIAYFIATLPLHFFTSRWVKLPKEYVPVFLIAVGSIWVFYLVRPFLLVLRPDLFMYPKIGYINNSDHIRALLHLSVYSFLFLSGLYLAVTRGAKKKRPSPLYFDSNKAGMLLNNRQIIIFGGGLIVLFDLYLLLGQNIGVSGTYSPLAFIRLFLPLGLVMPVFALYLVKFRRHLTRVERTLIFSIIGLSVLTSLLQGHKSALLSLVEIVFLLYLFDKGDLRISGRKILCFGAPVIVIAFLLFPIATVIRGFMQLDGFSLDIFGIIFESIKSLPDEKVLLGVLDMVTGRFCGYDGLLAVNLYKPPELHSIFNELYVLKHALASVVPRFYCEGISLGKAVGVYYTGHSFDIKHAGAIGLFASIILIGKGTLSYFYILIIGSFFGMCFRFAVKLGKNYESRILLSIIFSLQLIGWMISGNLDRVLSWFIIICIHFAFYSSVCWFMYKACKPKRNLSPDSMRKA
jgi:hypothetical protein